MNKTEDFKTQDTRRKTLLRKGYGGACWRASRRDSAGPLAAAGGHEQMGDAEHLELMGDPFSVVRLHADHSDVAEEIPALVPGLSRSGVRKSGAGAIQTGQIVDFESHLATLNGMALIGRTREIKELEWGQSSPIDIF